MLRYFTIDQLLDVNHWVVIGGLLVMILIVFYVVEIYERKRKP